MAVIKMRKLQADTEDVLFDCGNAGINAMVRRSYYPTLLQHLYAFEILADGKTVGYYMLGFKKFKLTDCPGEIGEYISDMSEYCYSLHIRYIAVATAYQHYGIGTVALKMIIGSVKDMCSIWPVRFITLDALKERVDWYKRIGFVMFNDKDITNREKDVRMYLDCLLDRTALNQYCS